MTIKVNLEKFSDSRLIQIIMSNQPGPDGMSKMRALAALRQSRSTKKAEVFASILSNRKEQRKFKIMAVWGLYELGGQRGEQALIENAQNADEYTAAPFAQALGRIGSECAIPIMNELQKTAIPFAKASVAFAVSLLAYRLHLEGHEIELPKHSQLLKLPADSKTIDMKIAEASDEEAILAMEALKQEPVGIVLTRENAQKIVCGPNVFVLLWNHETAQQPLPILQKRKFLVGLLFRIIQFEEACALSLFVLCTPDGEKFKVSLHRSLNGEAMYIGWGKLDGAKALFDIQAVQRPGASAIKFTGSVRNGQLAMGAALTATRVQSPRKPVRDSDKCPDRIYRDLNRTDYTN